MSTRLAVLSDVHGNAPRSRPCARRSGRTSRTSSLVAGDLVMNGPDPAAARSTSLREHGGRWRDRRPGQHRHRRRRRRLRGGLPVAARIGVPGSAPARRRVGPRRARPTSGSTGCAGCRPSAASSSTTRCVLVTHASPGSQTPGFDQATRPDRDPRADRPDGRPGHLLRPHPHPRGPGVRLEGHRQRRLRRLRLRRRPDGVVGARRRSTATSVTGRDPAGRVRRPGRRRTPSPPAACPATSTGPPRSAPGSWSDESGRGGRAPPRRRDRHGRGHRARARRRVDLGRPRRRPIRRADDRVVRPVAGRLADRGRGARTSTRATSSTARTCGASTATSSSGSSSPARRMDQAGPARAGSRARSRSGPASSSAPGSAACDTLFDNVLDDGRARSGPDQPVLHRRWASPTSAPARSRSRSGCSGRTSRPSPPAPPAPTRSARSSETIRRGDADVMLAGGAEAAIHEAVVGGFASMQALSTRNDDPAAASRPFDTGPRRLRHRRGRRHARAREPWSSAEARGAEPLAELVGYGATADAAHITLPAPGGSGAVRAARRALEKAGHRADGDRPRQRPCDVDAGGRRAELQAMRTLFGDVRRAGRDHGQQVDARPHARVRPGRSKSIATIQAIREGVRAADDQPRDPDPRREGLDLTPDVAQQRDIRVALNNSFGFGGQNTALIFRRWGAERRRRGARRDARAGGRRDGRGGDRRRPRGRRRARARTAPRCRCPGPTRRWRRRAARAHRSPRGPPRPLATSSSSRSRSGGTGSCCASRSRSR